jgi:hypothetical protein
MKRARIIPFLLLMLPLLSLFCWGVVGVVKIINKEGQTQPIAQTQLFTTQYLLGTYRLSWYTVVTSTTATAGTLSGELQYTDQDLGAEVLPFMSNVSASTIGPSSGSVVFRTKNGPVTFNVNFDSNVNGTPTYNLHLVVENISVGQ